MTTDEIVTGAIAAIVQRKNSQLVDVIPTHLLGDELGFASLDIAELVATLEMKLGFDPFASGASIASVRTVADVIELYKKASA